MNLGIEGKWALVCASSKGLGKGCAAALAAEGVNLVVTARGAEGLEATAAELRALGRGEVRAVAGDITTEAGRAAALAACPQVDILVNNAGGPPPGDFRQWDREAWVKAIDANMLTPIELIKATVDKMAERGWGRVVNITSSSVKAPIDVLGLSNGARSGLTGFVAGLARTGLAARGVTINGLLPGVFDTDRIRTVSAATPPTSPARTCSPTAAPIPGPIESPASRRRHVGAAVPALIERPVDDLAAGAAGPMPVGRMAQGVEQAAGALELGVVGDPDLGQRLVRRQLAGDAAGVHALHRGGDAGVAEQVGPQGGEGQVRSAGQSFHRRLSGTIAHLTSFSARTPCRPPPP